MTIRAKQWYVAVLAVSAAFVGVWAAAFPVSFYTDFPLPDCHWVSSLGPYNEHLVRDVGGLYLALLVLSVWVWQRPTPSSLRMAGGAWLLFSAEHFLWHALHLDGLPVVDKVGNMVALGGTLLLSVLLVLPERPALRAPSPSAAGQA
jgi:hypothetical protein